MVMTNNPSNFDAEARELVGRLSLDEKLSLFTGRDDWHLRGLPDHGLPPLRVTDCGHGVTLAEPPYGSATCFPTSVGLSSTWDPDLLFEVGAALGRETRAKGCGILLGPMINLHRTPLGGRNYESFSEDPLLTGRLAAAWIRGLQSTGVGACLKVLACNNQQLHQYTHSVELDETTLRELYLKASEIAIRESQPWAVMTSYNQLRGFQTSEYPHLLRSIVRKEWGYDGVVISDWGAVRSPKALAAGMDIEMPGPGKHVTPEKLRVEMEEGRLSAAQVDEVAVRIIRLLFAAKHHVDGPSELDSPRHRSLARKAAERSVVLLKNDNAVLPLQLDSLKSLAVIGPNAAHARLGGGGSASVTPFYSISPLDGLRELAAGKCDVRYAEGCFLVGDQPTVPSDVLRTGPQADAPHGLTGKYFETHDTTASPSLERVDAMLDFSWGWSAPGHGVPRFHFGACWSGWLIPPATGLYTLGFQADQAMARLYLDDQMILDGWDSTGFFEDCFTDRAMQTEIELEDGRPVKLRMEFAKTGPKTGIRLQWVPPGRVDPVDEAVQLAADSDAVVICAGLCNLLEGGANDRKELALPGRQAELIEKVAAVNPRTAVVLINGSVVSVSEWLEHVPALVEAWYPGQEGGRALAQILTGEAEPVGRLPDTFFRRAEEILALQNYPGNATQVDYAEGRLVGYRQIRPDGPAPIFPFGHGLSYTTFELHDLGRHNENGQQVLNAEVHNTGKRDGETVVQFYREKRYPAADEPWRELAGWQRVHLAAGERRIISIPATADDSDHFHMLGKI